MRIFLLLLISLIFFLQEIAIAQSGQMIEANGLIFRTDLEKPNLSVGESAVFPYSDEATILLEMAAKIKNRREKNFSFVIDPFCGDGKSGLPIVFNQIAEKLIGSDINSRAVDYARLNAQLNHLESKSCFSVGDIRNEGVKGPETEGNTLWIANPPFALKAKGASLDSMRDGGENGLTLTLAFVNQSLSASKPGDVILGIGYSRIESDGRVELEEELTKMIRKHGGQLQMVLLEGQKLWGGFNGKKEQENPMPITEELFALKADPSNQEEIEAYHRAAQFHNKAGFNKLGFFAYIIYK